jgi:hypothetical protein
MRSHRLPYAFALSILTLATLAPVHAETEPAPHPFKLSLAWYRYGPGSSGQDLNLRYEAATTRAWLAHYHDRDFGHQSRTGFEHSFKPADALSVLVSGQVATRGFVGGSVTAVLGDPWFVVIGWGRTNLRPYFNLNFDPNDAITAGFGWKGPHDTMIAATVVADDRLGTGQRIAHAFARSQLSDDLRVTVDLNHKRGEGDMGYVSGWGVSSTIDYRRAFLRLAWDQKQNFTLVDATRITLGVRF